MTVPLACGTCSTALADALLPPIYLWVLVGASWMMATAVLSWRHDVPIGGHPGPLGTVGLYLMTVAASVWLGMGIGVFLFVPPALTFLRAVRGSARVPDASLRNRLRQLGIVAVVLIVTAITASVWIHSTRSTGEFVVRWQGTGVASSILRGDYEESEARDLYRYVLRHGGQFIAADAAAQLSTVGDRSDVERLREALARAEEERWSVYSKDALQSAIQTLGTEEGNP
jgi:hypothetical protein